MKQETKVDLLSHVARVARSLSDEFALGLEPRVLFVFGHFISEMIRTSSLNAHCYLIGLLYLERALWNGRRRGRPASLRVLSVSNENFLETYLAAVLLSAKMVHETSYSNRQFVSMGQRGLALKSLSLARLNEIELEFLRQVDYRLAVTLDDVASLLQRRACFFFPCPPPPLVVVPRCCSSLLLLLVGASLATAAVV